MVAKLKALIDTAAIEMLPDDAGPVRMLPNERQRWTAALHFLLAQHCARYSLSATRWHQIEIPFDLENAAKIETETNEWIKKDLIIRSFLSQYCGLRFSDPKSIDFGMIGIVLPDSVVGGKDKVVYSVLDDLVLSSAMACRALSMRLRTGGTPAENRRTPPTPPATFPTPIGAQWSDVRMKFIDGEAISITIGETKGRYLYSELGMMDGRHKKPTKQWQLLQEFARTGGTLGWGDAGASRRNQKRCESLVKDLIAFFGIDGWPITYDKKAKCWRTAFIVEPDV